MPIQVPGPMKRLWTWLPKICCPVVLTAWSMPTVPDIRFQTMQIWRSGQPVKELTCRERAKNVRSGELQQLSWPSVETRVLSAFLLLVRSWSMMCGAVVARTAWIRRLGRNIRWWVMQSAKGFIIQDARTAILHISLVFLPQMIPGLKKIWKRLDFRTSRKPGNSMQSARWKSMGDWQSIRWIRRIKKNTR